MEKYEKEIKSIGATRGTPDRPELWELIDNLCRQLFQNQKEEILDIEESPGDSD